MKIVSKKLLFLASKIKTASTHSRWAKNFPRNSYLYKFFLEKDIPEKTFEVKSPRGVSHTIPNEVVIEHIALTRGRERAQIENIIEQIDLKNGDINHFFEHLAKGIVAQYNDEAYM